jgi:large subunit ribosomal protein L32e
MTTEQKETHAPAHSITSNEAKASAPVETKVALPTETKTKTETKTQTVSLPKGKAKAPAKEKKGEKEAKEAKVVNADPTPNKPAKKKGVKSVWVKKEKVKKETNVKDIQDTLNNKWKPVFWGRFGKKILRKRSDPKYDKWRKPRGEDMQQRRDDGAVVDAGYRTPKAIRGIHPSGYREVMVFTLKDLEQIKPFHAARLSGTIGRKKRIELIKFANEKKIPVLN